MQVVSLSSELTARPATPVARTDAQSREARIASWREAAEGGRGSRGASRSRRAEEPSWGDSIDLDVLWEDLDGLLGAASSSLGARRVSPLAPSTNVAMASYRDGAALGAPAPRRLVDAFA